jgi:hypothetical protein
MKGKLLALVGLSLLLAASANAQTMLKVTVPFEFIVDGQTLPAGDYTIGGVSAPTLAIQSADRNVNVMSLPHACESLNIPETSKLVFHQYGGQYFLSQIWTESSNRGREYSKSAREKELARSFTKNVAIQAALR